MDLRAYMLIPTLSGIAEENGIIVPRLRGYDLMLNEEAVPVEIIRDFVKASILDAYDWACVSVPRFNPRSNAFEFSSRTDRIKKKYLVTDEEGEIIGFNWNLIHGKRRKRLKYALKQIKKSVENYYEIFNKYAGRPDVLRVHARIGGGNWPHYCKEVVDKPWFLEKVDDFYDDTYCDIYCKINPITPGE